MEGRKDVREGQGRGENGGDLLIRRGEGEVEKGRGS